MGTDEVLEDLGPAGGRERGSGSRSCGPTSAWSPALLRRVAAEADRLGVVLTFEVQGTATPGRPRRRGRAGPAAETGSPYLGLTMDFSVTSRALPGRAGHGAPPPGAGRGRIAAVHRIWAEDWPIGRRIGTALARGRRAPAGAAADRPGRRRARPVRPHGARRLGGRAAGRPPRARQDLGSRRRGDPRAARRLARRPGCGGYSGAVVSEWGGHEMLDRAEADALTVTRDHLALLAELVADPG